MLFNQYKHNECYAQPKYLNIISGDPDFVIPEERIFFCKVLSLGYFSYDSYPPASSPASSRLLNAAAYKEYTANFIVLAKRMRKFNFWRILIGGVFWVFFNKVVILA